MNGVVNKERDIWVRPWMKEKFDDLYDRDERFFSLLVKGVLGWLSSNIMLYNKPIKHVILNTGSAYMYVESNGYEYTWCTPTGEDWIYMEMPVCICTLGAFSIPTEELSSPFVRGTYERVSSKDNQIRAYNAEIRRLPVEMSMQLHYNLSNFNESIVLVEELFDKLIFQKYFKITYLGQTVDVSIEFMPDTNINLNKIDMTSTEVNKKEIEFDIKICTSYPIINERTEIPNTQIIQTFGYQINVTHAINDGIIDGTKDPNSAVNHPAVGDRIREYGPAQNLGVTGSTPGTYPIPSAGGSYRPGDTVSKYDAANAERADCRGIDLNSVLNKINGKVDQTEEDHTGDENYEGNPNIHH